MECMVAHSQEGTTIVFLSLPLATASKINYTVKATVATTGHLPTAVRILMLFTICTFLIMSTEVSAMNTLMVFQYVLYAPKKLCENSIL